MKIMMKIALFDKDNEIYENFSQHKSALHEFIHCEKIDFFVFLKIKSPFNLKM